MDDVKDVEVFKADDSKYMKIYRVKYTQNGTQKLWDLKLTHDSVGILIHHVERDTFIFVKQFRPAVYVCQVRSDGQDINKPIDTNKTPPFKGITYELCAGIIDKTSSLVEIAKEEILEECGYDVPIEKIEKITTARLSIGTGGAQQTMYYAPVTEAMKTGEGGGNAHEGELIETVEVPVKESYKFLMDENKETSTGVLFAVLWYFQTKSDKK